MSKETQLFIMLMATFFLVSFMWFQFGSRYVGYIYNRRTQSKDFAELEKMSLKLISYESEERPEAVFPAFARKGVSVVVGPPTTAEGRRILPYLQMFKMRAFSATISSERLLETGYFYSLTPANSALRQVLEDLMENLNVRKLLLVIDPTNRPYSEEFGPLVEKFGGEAVTFSEKELLSGLSRVDITNFDAALLTTYSRTAANVAKVLRTINPSIRLFGADSVFSEDLLRFGGTHVEGMIVVYPYDSVLTPELEMIGDCLRFLEKHRFLSSEQFARFLDNGKVESGGRWVSFDNRSAVRPINVFVVRDRRFHLLGRW